MNTFRRCNRLKIIMIKNAVHVGVCVHYNTITPSALKWQFSERWEAKLQQGVEDYVMIITAARISTSNVRLTGCSVVLSG